MLARLRHVAEQNVTPDRLREKKVRPQQGHVCEKCELAVTRIDEPFQRLSRVQIQPPGAGERRPVARVRRALALTLLFHEVSILT